MKEFSIIEPLYFGSIKTPIGNMIACATEKGIYMLQFEEQGQLLLSQKAFQNNRELINAKNDVLIDLELQIEEYFSGTLKNFTVQYDIKSTPFQNKVFDIVGNIAYGTTKSYSEIAFLLGDIKNTRAVASANARNIVLLLIPCHRVIGSGNKLTGYRGGLDRKRWLLDFERTHSGAINQYELF